MKLVYEGPFFANSSLAIINRNLCQHFLNRCDLKVIPTDRPKPGSPSAGQKLQDAIAEPGQPFSPQKADVHIRHKWPPDLSAPGAGRWVHYQPWEFGALPAAWARAMENGPDRVWAYSGFLRDCFEKNGIEKNIIDIVPPGLDPETYRPGAGSDEELGKDTRFKFLFVGGTIFRKGIDILLRAYAARFAFRDDVLLVIKDYPCNSVYENAGFSGVIGKLKTIKGMPAIRHITEDLPDRRMAGLYASCDCLVAPYRAEGFGMPIIEALACGCPAIVTGYGAALDFCREGPCRLVSAEVKESGEKKILGMETSVSPFWAEADAPALAEAMGQVRENAGPMKKNALEYAAEILKNYCWKNVAEHAFEKIKNLF